MKFRILAVGVALGLIASTSPVRSYTPPAGSPLANREHPRVLISSATLPALRAKLGAGGAWAADFKTWVAWADARYGGIGSVAPRELGLQLCNYALLYVTYPVPGVSYGHTRAEYGEVGRQMLLRFTAAYPQAGTYDWYGVPLAYDWLHPLLTTADKQAIVAVMKSVDAAGLTKPAADPFNSQVAVARAQKLLSGLVFSGDGIDDAWAHATLDRYPEFFADTTGVTRSESDLSGEDGGAGQGIAYGFAYTGPHVVVAEEAWRVANGIAAALFYSDKPFLRRMPKYFAHLVLPWAPPAPGLPNNRRYVLAKTQRAAANTGAAETFNVKLLTALTGVLKSAEPAMSGLAQWLRDERTGDISAGDVYYAEQWALWKFVLGDRVTPIDPVEAGLPLSRASKDGKFVFRTGWDSLNDSYVSLIANKWHRNPFGMSPNSPGGFTIDRNGPQVIHQSNGGHDWGGAGAGPANVLLFVDPVQNGPTGNWDDHGGHRLLPGETKGSVDFVPGSPWDLSGATRFLPAAMSDGRDVDYVSVDVTRAYNSTQFNDGYNPARVSEVVRQLVYFRPAVPGTDSDRVVVFDRAVTTDTKFEKRWLFHTSGDPQVNGSEAVGRPIRNGTGVGKWTYTGATRVTATNTVNGSNGRTFLSPLLPENRTIVKVGGPNAKGLSWQADSHEYEDPYGVVHPGNPPDSPNTGQYVGNYRVEIIPSTRALSDVFLNVVEVGNANMTAATSTVALPSSDLVAVRIGDRIAVFNRASSDVRAGTMTVDAAGTYRIHFADLSPNGRYEITFGGGATMYGASDAGSLYVQQTVATGTRVTIRQLGAAAGGPPPAAPTNLRVVP